MAQIEVFRHFPEFGSLVFLDIPYNDGLLQYNDSLVPYSGTMSNI